LETTATSDGKRKRVFSVPPLVEQMMRVIDKIRGQHRGRRKVIAPNVLEKVKEDNLIWAKLPGFPWFPAEVSAPISLTPS
jgi:hypothetical protein